MTQMVAITLVQQEDVLLRLLGLLYRKGYLIESFSAIAEDSGRTVKVTAILKGNNAPRQLLSYITKLVDVLEAEVTV